MCHDEENDAPGDRILMMVHESGNRIQAAYRLIDWKDKKQWI
jgi:hypothetical protein